MTIRIKDAFAERVEDIFFDPIRWVPSARNSTKLLAERWDGEKWVSTPYCKFVRLDITRDYLPEHLRM